MKDERLRGTRVGGGQTVPLWSLLSLLSLLSFRSCYEVVCQGVIAGKFSSNDLISLLSVLEAPVMYAIRNLGCAIF